MVIVWKIGYWETGYWKTGSPANQEQYLTYTNNKFSNNQYPPLFFLNFHRNWVPVDDFLIEIAQVTS